MHLNIILGSSLQKCICKSSIILTWKQCTRLHFCILGRTLRQGYILGSMRKRFLERQVISTSKATVHTQLCFQFQFISCETMFLISIFIKPLIQYTNNTLYSKLHVLFYRIWYININMNIYIYYIFLLIYWKLSNLYADTSSYMIINLSMQGTE